jgi:anti-sigma factor RsiW
MSSHLSYSTLSALADGQLATEEMASANQHLASCPACTSQALSQFVLKSTTAKAGRQYAPSPEFQDRIAKLASGRSGEDARNEQARLQPRANVMRWGALAALLLVCIGLGVLGKTWLRPDRFARRDVALVSEVCDQHIAMMAAGLSPQVISTDRHTVKPWFQGKLPFSFNLPADLPTGMTLDGADLAYLGGQPAAQLLYSIGKHRASVFVRQPPDAESVHSLEAERSGFHVDGFRAGHIEMIAVSDADPVRLRDLVNALERAQ